jgi:hypothetical protein
MSKFTVRYGDENQLPAAPGLYIVYSGAICLYVGSSKNVRRRVVKHNKKADFAANNATHIDFAPVTEAQLSDRENEAVYKLRPMLNTYAKRGKPPATARHTDAHGSKLRDVTLQLLNSRRRTLTLTKIAEETGLGVGFISTFSTGKTPNPGVCSVETLYEYLSGKKLDV